MLSLTDGKEVANDAESEEIEIKKEVFEMKQTPVFYTQPFGHYEQNPRSKRVYHKGVLENLFISNRSCYCSWKQLKIPTMTPMKRWTRRILGGKI